MTGETFRPLALFPPWLHPHHIKVHVHQQVFHDLPLLKFRFVQNSWSHDCFGSWFAIKLRPWRQESADPSISNDDVVQISISKSFVPSSVTVLPTLTLIFKIRNLCLKREKAVQAQFWIFSKSFACNEISTSGSFLEKRTTAKKSVKPICRQTLPYFSCSTKRVSLQHVFQAVTAKLRSL